MAEIEPRGKDRHFVRVFLGRVDGKKQYHSKMVHGKRNAAERYARDIETKRDLKTLTKGDSLTLSDLVELWLKGVKEKKVRPRTLAHYRKIMSTYIDEKWGGVMIAEIKQDALQGFYNDKVAEGLSKGTLKYIHAVLRPSLTYATRLDYIPKNPTDFLVLPPDDSKEIVVLDVEEAKRFIQALDGHLHRTAFLAAITLGMRPSEYTGLQWSDLDVHKQEISVKRTVIFPDTGSWYIGPTKTKNSIRTMDVPPTLMAALLNHKRAQAELRLKRGPKWLNHDFMFTTRDGEPLCQSYLNQALRRILTKAGIDKRLTIYCLRHTYATLALAQGMDDKILSESMGHASVSFTKDKYQHVLKSMKVQLRDTLEAILFGKKVV